MQAGAELSSHGANNKALSFFGLEWITKKDWAGSLAGLESMGLPCFTAPSPSEVADNDHVISSLMKRDATCPARRLVLCFDRTYIHQTSQLLHTSKGHIFAGGPHRCEGFEKEDLSQIILKSNDGTIHEVTLVRDRDRANEMEALVMWDPTRTTSGYWEIAAYPVTAAADRHELLEKLCTNPRGLRGQFETMARLGMVLQNAPSIKFIIADRHGSHAMLCSCLLGKPVALPKELMDALPFYGSLKFMELPELKWPLPFRICLKDDVSIHFLPGVAHSQKNFGEQLRSVLSTPHFGLVWSDFSGCLDLGLVPTSFMGTDEMSDRQAALLFPGN